MWNKLSYFLILIFFNSCFVVHHKRSVLNENERGDNLNVLRIDGYYFRELEKEAYPYYKNEYGGISESKSEPYQQKLIEPLILNKNGSVRIFSETSGSQDDLWFDYSENCLLLDFNSIESAKQHFECLLNNDDDRYSIWGKGVFGVDSTRILIQYYVNWRGDYYLQEKSGEILNETSFILTERFDYKLDKRDMINELYLFQKFNKKPDSSSFITEHPRRFGSKKR